MESWVTSPMHPMQCFVTPPASRHERRVTGRFAPSPVRPIGRIQRFMLIQLKPKHVFRCGACGAEFCDHPPPHLHIDREYASNYSGNWTFRPLTFPAYSVKTQAPLFGCFNYSCHSVHMSCWTKGLLTYLAGAKRLGGGRNVQGRTDKSAKRP